jgi:hypothetical protein
MKWWTVDEYDEPATGHSLLGRQSLIDCDIIKDMGYHNPRAV